MRTHNAKIVCATDFSAHANSAALAAAWIASRLEATLQVVHVIDPKRYRDVTADFMNYLRKERQKKLNPLVERAGHRGATVEANILEGAPVNRIVEIASEPDVRLLILATAGQIAPTQWLTGSVADGVAQRATVPTLILRDSKLVEAWLKGERPLRIVVGYDFSPDADAAVVWSESLRKIAPIDLTVVYVASATNERRRLRIAPPLSPFYYPSGLKTFLETELKQAIDSSLGENAATICVKADWGRVESQLIETAGEYRADLIVTGTSKRRGLSRLASVSRAVLHYAPANVVCVPVPRIAAMAHVGVRSFKRVLVPIDFSEEPEQAVG